ncbi:MAG: TetR family transcriptional regulator C-terminal domain-containing protein [Thermomicrobiales bacterium]
MSAKANLCDDAQKGVMTMPGEKMDEEVRRRQILQTALRIARRDRLEGISVRGLAKEAGVSMGLIGFYFGSKDGLLAALLDDVIARIVDEGFRAVDATPDAGERLLATVERLLDLIGDPETDIRVLLDFWLRGGTDPEVRRLLQHGLARFRVEMRGIAVAMIADQPERFVGVTAEGLATVAMSAIEGTMFQAVLYPGDLDVAAYMAALRALVRVCEESPKESVATAR